MPVSQAGVLAWRAFPPLRSIAEESMCVLLRCTLMSKTQARAASNNGVRLQNSTLGAVAPKMGVFVPLSYDHLSPRLKR